MEASPPVPASRAEPSTALPLLSTAPALAPSSAPSASSISCRGSTEDSARERELARGISPREGRGVPKRRPRGQATRSGVPLGAREARYGASRVACSVPEGMHGLTGRVSAYRSSTGESAVKTPVCRATAVVPGLPRPES